jgi:pyruvyltransferase
MVTGSLLNDPIIESCEVWGTGIAFSDTFIRKPLKIHAVRGPISREIVQRFGHDCPEVYGDPCLLLPKFYKGCPTSSMYKLGIIPHVIDYQAVRTKYYTHSHVQIIDLFAGIEEVVNRVLECDVLISSSLHGIIVAHTYGRPCMWVKFSDNILGDGTKFHDYLRSVGHDIYEPLDMREDIYSVDHLTSIIPKNVTLNIDLDKLMEACPFRK